MDAWSAVCSGALLVVLWMWEGAAPAIGGKSVSRARRWRHVALGVLNAAAAGFVAAALVVVSEWTRSEQLGMLRWLGVDGAARVVMALLLLDALGYTLHVAAHYVPWLWRVHAVHHNADALEATVAMRFHTIEVVWTGLATIPFAAVLGISVEMVALYNALLLPVSLFHHANISLSPRVERVLRVIMVTPGLHRVHHSRWTPETNSNFGAILPVWDWAFGTLRLRRHPERIRVGLDGFTPAEIDELGAMLRTPFGPSTSGYGHASESDGDGVWARGDDESKSSDKKVAYTPGCGHEALN